LGNPERAGSLSFQGDLKCRKPQNRRSRQNHRGLPSRRNRLSHRNHRNRLSHRSRLRRRRKSRVETRTSTCPHRPRRETRPIRDRSRQSVRRGAKQRRMSAFDPLLPLDEWLLSTQNKL